MLAVRMNNMAMVRLLLDKGANPNLAPTPSGQEHFLWQVTYPENIIYYLIFANVVITVVLVSTL